MDITLILRKFRKSIAGFTILALIASFAFSGLAFAYTDDESISSWADDYVTQATDEGWMTGYDDGSFGPQDTITREQLAKVLVLAFLGYVDEDFDAGYTDAEDISDWALAYVNTANLYEFMTGSDGYFYPTKTLNRAEAAQALVNAAMLTELTEDTSYGPTFSDVDEDAWYYGAVETAYLYQIVDGKTATTFDPSGSATREAVAKMTSDALAPEMRDMSDNDSDADATLNIEVSDDTPEADTLPKYATSVPVATWDFTAEDGDVELDDLTVHQYGISSLSTVTLYLYNGTERLTSGKSVHSSDFTASFNNINLDIDEGDTVTLTVRADLGATSTTGEMGLEIVDEDALDVGEADVDGDFPLQAEKFSLATEAVGNVTVEANGSVSNPQVGEDNVTVAKFKVSSDSTTTSYSEDATLTEIGLYLTGTVSSDDVENFELYAGSDTEPIATVDGVDGKDVIRFVIEDGYEISKGSTKTFTVKADFNTGRTDDTVKIYVDEKTDVVAIGGSRGYGMYVTTTSKYDGSTCNGTTNYCSYSTLEGGDITISSSGPSATDIAINGKDIPLLNFTIVANTEVTFKNFPVSLDPSGDTGATGLLSAAAAANFTDIKVMDTDNDDEFMSAIDATSMTTAIGGATAIADGTDDDGFHLFTDEFTMEPGEELNLSLTADVANVAGLANMTVIAAIPLSATYPEIRDVNNKTLTNTSVLVPASTITGKTMTVKSPSLALSLASTPVAGSTVYVKGAQDVSFVGFIFACGDASGCLVTDLNLYSAIDADGDGTGSLTEGADTTNVNAVVNQVKLVDGDGEDITGYASVQGTTGLIEFQNIDWQLEAGESETVYVVGDIESAMSGDDIAFYVKAATDVTVYNDDESTFSATGTPNKLAAAACSTWITVKDGGQIVVSVASDTPEEDIVVSGATGVEVAKFKFDTTKASGGASESFVINDLSITNYQAGVADADLAEYDNNVSGITLVYENSLGEEVEAEGDLSSGVASFDELDFYVEKDGYSYLTVEADLNTISSGWATAAETVQFNLAINDLSATSGSGGEEYNAGRYDATYRTTNLSGFALGTVSWTDSTADVDGAPTAVALGNTTDLTYDDGADGDSGITFPVGTLLCSDTGATTCADGTEAIYVVTGTQTDNGADDTQEVRLVDNGAANVTATKAAANGDNVLYALPGTGYLTSTNTMYVYENKPTVTLNASSPSGTQTISSTDDIFIIDIYAENSGDQVQFRAAYDDLDHTNDSAGVDVGASGDICTPSSTTTAGAQLDGTSTGCEIATLAAGDTIAFAPTEGAGVFDDYARVSFWIMWTETAAGDDAQFADLKIGTGEGATTNTQQTALSQTACGANQATLVSTEWYYCDVAMPTGTDASDTHLHFEIDEVTEISNSDFLYIDEINLFNEKITLDIATDTDLDTYANNTSNAGSPVAVSLIKDGTTYGTGYVSTLTNGASATTTGTVVLIPTTEISITPGDTETLTFQTDTSDLLHEDSGDDPVTISLDYGTSSTAGDIYWYETNATVTWVGDTTSSTLTGDTLIY